MYRGYKVVHQVTRPLSRCYLRSYLVKNTAGAHKQPSKKYKSNLRTLKSKSYEQCRNKHEYYNDSWTTDFPDQISFEHAQSTQAFTSSTEM